MSASPLPQLLRAPRGSFASLAEFRSAWLPAAGTWPQPIDRALVGGALADRLGYAFAAGYGSALQAMDPGLPSNACLCVTEAGGAHPRAIQARLSRAEGGWRLDGAKRWATLAGEGDMLLVAASVGNDGDRNLLRVARVPAQSPGVARTPLPATPFTPEIPHYELRFDGVFVPEDALLPGDGWVDWVKPFRTVEDTHVGAAAAAHLLRLTRHEPALTARLSTVILAFRSIAALDARAPETHVALDGALSLLHTLAADAAPHLEAGDAEAAARWQRDSALLQVATKARRARFEAALQSIG
jgi:hypothetical protein